MQSQPMADGFLPALMLKYLQKKTAGSRQTDISLIARKETL